MYLVPIAMLAFLVVLIAAGWKIFTKAGRPGIASIIPIYNIIVTLDIIGKPMWWFVLCIIPGVNFIVGIIIALELAKCFGKDTVYGLGLFFLPFIFGPLLAFGDAQYIGKPA